MIIEGIVINYFTYVLLIILDESQQMRNILLNNYN